MDRVSKFKEVRKFKNKCILVLFMFFAIVSAGICVSDYSINTLMNNQKYLGLIKIEWKDRHNVTVNIMNVKFTIDTSYVTKDLEGFKNKLERMKK